MSTEYTSFQFLGIPPKGEREALRMVSIVDDCFQFLGIPPKGEPELRARCRAFSSSSFQFLGIPPKGEPPVTPHGVGIGSTVSNF